MQKEQLYAAVVAQQPTCGCPTCVEYRSFCTTPNFKTILMSGFVDLNMMSQVVPSEMGCVAASLSAVGASTYAGLAAPHCGLRSVGAVPILSMSCRSGGVDQGAAQRYPHNSYPYQQQQQVVAAPPPLSLSSSNENGSAVDTVIDVFFAECIGRIVEASCTADGKATLQGALRTQRDDVVAPVVEEVVKDMGRVALDVNGCHVLRALVEVCSADQTLSLIETFSITLIANMCTMSQYTRRPLQSLFERRLVDLNEVVYAMAQSAQYLCATQQGCISLIRIFELCDAEQRSALTAPLLPTFNEIARDAFGNYMVQSVIQLSDRTTAAQYAVTFFSGHLLSMSCDKFASNVVEKVMRCCGDVPAVRRMLLDELIYNPASLQELVNDNFGNFVIQSIVESTTQPMELKRVQDRLRPALVGCPFAAKIEAKLKSKKPAASFAPVSSYSSSMQPPHHRGNGGSRMMGGRNGKMVALPNAAAVEMASTAPLQRIPKGSSAVAPMASSFAPHQSAAYHRHQPYEPVGFESPSSTSHSWCYGCTASVNGVAGAVAPSPADHYPFPTSNAQLSAGMYPSTAAVQSTEPVYGPSASAVLRQQQQLHSSTAPSQ